MLVSIHQTILYWVYKCNSHLHESNGSRIMRIRLQMSKIWPKNQTMFTSTRPHARTPAREPPILAYYRLLLAAQPRESGRGRENKRESESEREFKGGESMGVKMRNYHLIFPLYTSFEFPS